MNKSKIEWTDYSWNPIKGLCPVGCWYCYARKMYKRFDLMEKLYAEDPSRDFELTEETIIFDEREANKPYETRVYAKREINPRKIFVCSTIEMFHPKIPKEYRDDIFKTISGCPQDTFQILTKMPENIDRPMPDNVWLGVSVTSDQDFQRLYHLKKCHARIKFVSFEPLLGRLSAPTILMCRNFQWAIWGRLTGYGHKHDPEREWIEREVDYLKSVGIPIFLKDNLKEIWGEKLIQQYPKEGI